MKNSREFLRAVVYVDTFKSWGPLDYFGGHNKEQRSAGGILYIFILLKTVINGRVVRTI